MTQDLQAMTVDELERLKQAIEDEMARRVNAVGLKPGDRVKHADGSFQNGVVVEVPKSGKRVKVRYCYLGGRFEDTGYFTPHKLRKIEEGDKP